MSYKDLLDVIFIFRSDVYLLWGWVITLNVALIGWLIQRHGLYGLDAKIIATVAYSAFLLLICFGMNDAYNKLDMAANELYGYDISYKSKKSVSGYTPVSNGIVKYYISRAPENCNHINKGNECKPYSNNFKIGLIGLFLGWLQNMALFWYSPIWNIVRTRQEKNITKKSS